MNLPAFKALASPAQLSLPLQALWHDAHGDWDRAHQLAQQAEAAEGDWVHAYLHRKEGDIANAGYWYARAGKPVVASSVPLADEWAEMVTQLLNDAAAS